jgi:CheY-like chemotaxis protein
MDNKDPLATSALPEIEDTGEINPQIRPDPDHEEPARMRLILVVDDSADHLAMLSLDLQQEGYRVVTATNGEEAVSVATSTQPDLILMDISMPTLDGLGATRRMRENGALRVIPIVAVTAFGTEGFQRAAYDAGVAGYLTKPIDFDRLHQLVARLLGPAGQSDEALSDRLR